MNTKLQDFSEHRVRALDQLREERNKAKATASESPADGDSQLGALIDEFGFSKDDSIILQMVERRFGELCSLLIAADADGVSVDADRDAERSSEAQRDLSKNLFRTVAELDLSVRSANCLSSADIEYVGELIQKTEEQMLKLPSFGLKSLKEIVGKLDALGLTLGTHVNNFPDRLILASEPAVPGDRLGEVSRDDLLPNPTSIPDPAFVRVDALDLSVRSANCLRKLNVSYLGELAQMSESRLRKIPNMGRKSLNELRAVLSERGLAFGMNSKNFPEREELDRLAPQRGDEPFVGHVRTLLCPVNCLAVSDRLAETLGQAGLEYVFELAGRERSELLQGAGMSEALVEESRQLLEQQELGLEMQLAGGPTREELERFHAHEAVETSPLHRSTSRVRFDGTMDQIVVQALDLVEEEEVRQCRILKERFGIDRPRQTLEAVGEMLGVTRERIRQLESKALKRLRDEDDLRQMLLASVRDEESRIWDLLSDEQPVVVDNASDSEFQSKLTASDRLVCAILEWKTKDLLGYLGVAIAGGWCAHERDRFRIERLAVAIEALDFKSPLPLETLASRVGGSRREVELASRFVDGVKVFQDYIWRGNAGRKAKRRILLHRILASYGPAAVVSAEKLLQELCVQFPEHKCSYRDIDVSISESPDMFLRVIARHWACAGESRPLSISSRQGGESWIDSSSPTGGLKVIRQVLADEGPMKLSLLEKKVLSRTTLSATSIGAMLHTSMGFSTLAPGLIGLPEHLDDVRVRQRCEAEMLSGQDCSRFVRSRFAGSKDEYPLWSSRMEEQWCVWAEKEAGEELFVSLLEVVEPSDWHHTDSAVVDTWQDRKNRLANYRMDADFNIPSIPTLPPFMDLLKGALWGRQISGLSWLETSKVSLGFRYAAKEKGLSIMACLVFSGGLTAAGDWRSWHPATGKGLDWVSEGLLELGKGKKLDWSAHSATIFRDQLNASSGRGDVGWIPEQWRASILSKIEEARGGGADAEAARGHSWVRLAAQIIWADRKLLPGEKDHLAALLTGIPSLQREDVARMLKQVTATAPRDLNPRVHEFRSKSEAARVGLLTDLFSLAAADGNFQKPEVELLKEVASGLGVEPKRFNLLSKAYIHDKDIATDELQYLEEASDETSDEDLLKLLL